MREHITNETLQKLRKIYCTCDDGTLCTAYTEKLTKDCEESCLSFCNLYTELEKLVGA